MNMVTVGGRISCQFAYCKNILIQRCRVRQLSTETQRAFQGVRTRSETCFLSGTAHSAKFIVAAASFTSQWSHSLHSFSTCCSTSSIIKDNCYLNNLAYQSRRTGTSLKQFYFQFHLSSLRKLLTDAAPSAFRIHVTGYISNSDSTCTCTCMYTCTLISVLDSMYCF